ncbi:MAG: hypothetical protein Q9227_001157 [Pyrenula ochraceoflavens]
MDILMLCIISFFKSSKKTLSQLSGDFSMLSTTTSFVRNQTAKIIFSDVFFGLNPAALIQRLNIRIFVLDVTKEPLNSGSDVAQADFYALPAMRNPPSIIRQIMMKRPVPSTVDIKRMLPPFPKKQTERMNANLAIATPFNHSAPPHQEHSFYSAHAVRAMSILLPIEEATLFNFLKLISPSTQNSEHQNSVAQHDSTIHLQSRDMPTPTPSSPIPPPSSLPSLDLTIRPAPDHPPASPPHPPQPTPPDEKPPPDLPTTTTITAAPSQPIHPLLPTILLPPPSSPSTILHPNPPHPPLLPSSSSGQQQQHTITPEQAAQLEQLLKAYPTKEAAEKGIEEVAGEVRRMLEEREERRGEIERKVEEMEKVREIERKVLGRGRG